MLASVTTTHLELHVPDFISAREFYGKLGFEVIWDRTPEEFKGYLVLKMEENVLCFWGGNEYIYQQEYFKRFSKNTKRGYGVEIIIMVENIERYYEKVRTFCNVVEKLVEQPWGIKDFRIVDPFGYYLRITSNHNILDNNFAVK